MEDYKNYKKDSIPRRNCSVTVDIDNIDMHKMLHLRKLQMELTEFHFNVDLDNRNPNTTNLLQQKLTELCSSM
ncbi:hypothetical protein A3Q56_01296 [Intoshia linei]|uniref:Uncharacterized protein n=1 Tax=Intoshia linei TaxID=1819745 RepID=A0A177B9B2_9BILA|nr:hypothetical protein A3Q56_01296 [Intoshia linei]